MFEAPPPSEDQLLESSDEPGAQEGDENFSTAEEAAQLLSQYWAADQDTKKLWAVCRDKAEEFHQALNRRGYYAVYRLIYSMFFGMTPPTGTGYDYSTTTVSFAGEDDEVVELNLNEIRSFVDQVVTMVTSTRPAFQAVATNTDYQTLSQVMASDTVVQHYYATAYNEMKERATVDREARYGKAFSHLQWDSDGGRMVDSPQPPVDSPAGPLPQDPIKVKSGAIRISSKYHWDVICEPYRSEHDDHLWRLVKEEDIDKWEAMARFPAFAKQISDSRHPGDPWESFKPGWDPSAKHSIDACSVHWFYHARTSAMPQGRQVMFVNDVAVIDEPLPIEEIPVYPLISCEMDRTCFGVSDLWNLIPAEQMMNAAVSDMATNIDSFGRPPLIMTEGTDIDLDSLANGQTVLFKPPNTDDPAPMKFPAIPEITPRMIEMMREFKMTAAGSNAVARGDTSSDITSGAHAALYSQKAVENQSPRQLSLDLHRERVANGMLKMLKKFGKHPQLVAIAGVDERPYMDEFKPEQWNTMDSVTMKVVNPALRTVSGRLQVVEMLRDWPGQPLKDPQRIIDLITTGQMRTLMEPTRVMELHARWENEELLKGPPVTTQPGEPDPITGAPTQVSTVQTVPALVTDNLATHLTHHFEVLYSPASRRNPAVLQAVQTHIQEHLRVARMSDPMLSAIVGNPSPDAGVVQPDAGNDGSGPSDRDIKGAENAAKAPGGEDDSKGASLPKPAQPPAGA